MANSRDYYEEQLQKELEAHRNYWTMQVHWAPFQGPDKLPRTIKIGGMTSHTMVDIHPKPRKTELKPTKTSTAHVEMSQRTFYSTEGYAFQFWALAPSVPGVRWGSRVGTTEFVWLILDGTNGRGIHHALVDKESDVVYWWGGAAEHFVSKEISKSA